MELIKIGSSTIGPEVKETVNARELHAFLEVKSEFRNWVKNRIQDFGFTENQDFVTVGNNLPGGGKQTDYYLTIDMAKELSMVERNDKGKQARQYFIECEKRVLATPVIHDLQTRALVKLLTDQDALKQEQNRQAAMIEDMSGRLDTLTPRMTASSITRLLGAISHSASLLRQAQTIKHIKMNVGESTGHFHLLITDHFQVADINYLPDTNKAYRLLKEEDKKNQAIIDEWHDRNNLFTQN